MKKTAKLIALAALLFAGFGTTNANAEGFKLGADVVSSYVWRGSELGRAAAIQPSLSYTCKSGVVIGAWGSYDISDDNRYKEIDLTVSVPVGPATFAVTAYNSNPDGGETIKFFDYTEDSANVVEISAAYAAGDLSLLAAINVAGSHSNSADYAKYCEAGYKVYDKDGYTAKAVVGLGDENYYGDGATSGGKKIAVVNTGISVSKDRYTGSFVYNPDTENSYLVFMASF